MEVIIGIFILIISVLEIMYLFSEEHLNKAEERMIREIVNNYFRKGGGVDEICSN